MSGTLGRLCSALLIGLIRLYQVLLSPFMGGQCRFHPTCSHYGLDAIRQWGPWRGSWLTIRRILRCIPFVTGGYDPVPLKDVPPNHAPPATDPR
jgi:putative membrane protein insertion efficiency factor